MLWNNMDKNRANCSAKDSSSPHFPLHRKKRDNDGRQRDESKYPRKKVEKKIRKKEKKKKSAPVHE